MPTLPFLSLLPASALSPHGRATELCPCPQRRGPPACRARSALLRQPGPVPPRLPRDSGPMPLARAPHVPHCHPPVSAFPRLSSIREVGGHGGASVWFNPKAPQSGWPFGGASEVRSQPTHWGRGPGAQVESLGEDVQGVCPEEGGGLETASLPAGVAGAGRGSREGGGGQAVGLPPRSCSESHRHLGTWGL